MRIRNWLLTGTSLTLMALAPLSPVYAQDASDPALKDAFAAYAADQSDDNKQKLNEACIAAGFASFEDCVAAISGAQPIDQPSKAEKPKKAKKAPASEAAPPPADQPAASEEAAPPADQQPAAEAPSSEEAAPAPAPSSEQPVKKKKKAAKASSEEAAPAQEEAAPAPSSEEAAPAPSSEEAAPAPAPSSEEAAPAPAPSSEEAAPAPSADQGADVLAQLTAAVDLYNQGVAQLDAGDASGQAKVDQAKGQIDAICTAAGMTDTTACLAQFGLELQPLPQQPAASSAEQPAPSAEQPATTSEEPAAPSEEQASSVPPISELPNASEAVDPTAVEPLPADVSSEEAAPVLDSAKDQQNASGQPSSEQPADQSSASSEQPPAEQPPAGPPPADDKAAQQDIQPPPKEDQSTVAEKGTKKQGDFSLVDAAPPKDVKVVQKPKADKGGLVFQIGVNIYINNPQQERDRYFDRNRGDTVYYEDLSRGRTREVVERKDGTKVVTIYDRYGDVLQRSKILRDGREIYLASYDPRDDQDLGQWRDPGDELPPLVLNIPASQYILDADTADEDQVETFLDQPPVEQVRRIYSIDEVKRSARLRDSVRRLEVGGLTFDTGKATISRDQVGTLSKVAKAMQAALDKNPGEVFLIEGHTDAVGSDVSNLVLSDERAATVARILTDFYEIPAENLVTQGYGERYLKVKTDGPEALNRRVTIKRITPLVSYEAANQ